MEGAKANGRCLRKTVGQYSAWFMKMEKLQQWRTMQPEISLEVAEKDGDNWKVVEDKTGFMQTVTPIIIEKAQEHKEAACGIVCQIYGVLVVFVLVGSHTVFYDFHRSLPDFII